MKGAVPLRIRADWNRSRAEQILKVLMKKQREAQKIWEKMKK
jgi:hypothetical protein